MPVTKRLHVCDVKKKDTEGFIREVDSLPAYQLWLVFIILIHHLGFTKLSISSCNLLLLMHVPVLWVRAGTKCSCNYCILLLTGKQMLSYQEIDQYKIGIFLIPAFSDGAGKSRQEASNSLHSSSPKSQTELKSCIHNCCVFTVM